MTKSNNTVSMIKTCGDEHAGEAVEMRSYYSTSKHNSSRNTKAGKIVRIKPAHKS